MPPFILFFASSMLLVKYAWRVGVSRYSSDAMVLCSQTHKAAGGRGGGRAVRHNLRTGSNIGRCFACVQVSCIYGLGMPSAYLEASIRIVVGQEWIGGWRALAQHLEQVPRHAGAFALHAPHAWLSIAGPLCFPCPVVPCRATSSVGCQAHELRLNGHLGPLETMAKTHLAMLECYSGNRHV